MTTATATTPAYEETAGAVGAATGGQTPQKGIEMNNPILAHDREHGEADKHRIAHGSTGPAFADLADLFRVAQHLDVPPGRILAMSPLHLTTAQVIASKFRLAADLIEEATALETELNDGDEDAFANLIRPYLTRIGCSLGDIPAEDVANATAVAS